MHRKRRLGNEWKRDDWSARELATVTKFLGCRIAFILPGGTA